MSPPSTQPSWYVHSRYVEGDVRIFSVQTKSLLNDHSKSFLKSKCHLLIPCEYLGHTKRFMKPKPKSAPIPKTRYHYEINAYAKNHPIENRSACFNPNRNRSKSRRWPVVRKTRVEKKKSSYWTSKRFMEPNESAEILKATSYVKNAWAKDYPMKTWSTTRCKPLLSSAISELPPYEDAWSNERPKGTSGTRCALLSRLLLALVDGFHLRVWSSSARRRR